MRFIFLLGLVFMTPFFVESFGSVQLLKKSIPIVKKHAEKYNVDESHNHIHSLEVANYCLNLIRFEANLSKTEQDIAILGSIFHDTIDDKYIPSSENTDELLQSYLEQVVGTHSKLIEPVILFSKSMSYSKTVVRQKDKSLTLEIPLYIQTHPYVRAFHLMRNADLLSSYNLKRCLLFRSWRNETKDSIRLYNEMQELYWNRMHMLRKYNILYLENPYCDLASKLLEASTERRIKNYENYITYRENESLCFEDLIAYFEVTLVKEDNGFLLN